MKNGSSFLIFSKIPGLLHKKIGDYDEALNFFHKLNSKFNHQQHPEVLFQIGHVYELMGDTNAALEYYHQLLGIVQMDSGVLKKVGELYEMRNDRQQAFHYHLEAYRLYPVDFSVINWIGSHFIELQIAEKAISYFEKAVLNNPNDSYFLLRVAGCYRRIGNSQKSLQLFQQIHEKFPENTDCLRALIHLTQTQGLTELNEMYIEKLDKLEKQKEVRQRINSSRPGTSSYNARIASSNSGKSNGGASLYSNNNNNEMSYNRNNSPVANSPDYSDPLEAEPKRPYTSGIRKQVEVESDDEIDDDLLPM
jgi:intraflagellar transport protein 88